MRSLVFRGPANVSLADLPVPVAGPGEALIRIETSAICGSELEAAPGGNPGHEAAGTIEVLNLPVGADSAATPSGSLRLGERVGISAVVGCGSCTCCLAGEQVYCPEVRVLDRLHADYAVVPVAALRKLPAHTPANDAVLLTGDACGVPIRALRRIPTPPSCRVLVIGLGPVGLAHVLVRAHDGAEVIATEPSPYRRDLAASLGAHSVHEPGAPLPWAPDLVIESTGRSACVSEALALAAPGATVLQSGWCTEVTLSPAATVLRREISYTGTWYYSDADYPDMVAAYRAGLPLGGMVTHEFPATDIALAYHQFVSLESGKVLIQWT